MVKIQALAERNLGLLKNNPYPGRGIVIGMTPDSKHLVQIYWIMGRSENSRNRIFVNENDFIKTEAFDPAKVKDPSLIIYYAAKHLNGVHIVTNGDQTDTIYAALTRGNGAECPRAFEDALDTRKFEPDAPNYTPRISGLIDLNNPKAAYQLSILKSVDHDPNYCVRQYYSYEQALPGFGHCLHTYSGDGDPLPSFAGEPYLVPLVNRIEDLERYYWEALNEENRISMLVKFIRLEKREFTIRIVNKHK
ncbi:MAG TPA: IMP cyclohydrolase [Bacillota bacterium]|nr:IMP cyclohydrolase [Bacillota bacterium]